MIGLGEEPAPGLDARRFGIWMHEVLGAFGADPEIVGRQIRLNEVPFTVVGIAPRGFAGTSELRPDVCLPFTSLRLLRSLVFGPMEHMLWEVVITGRQIDVEASARDLVALLWPALHAPDAELARLRRLRERLQDALAQG